jgi:hypothetical protein
MRKTIIILAMALMSFSCSTEDETTNDCNCGQVIQSTSFNVVNGEGGVDVFSIVKIKNNCSDEVVQTQLDGSIPVGSEICD